MALDKFGENEDEKKEKEDSLRVVSSVKKTLEDFRVEMENFNAIDWDAEISTLQNKQLLKPDVKKIANVHNWIFKQLLNKQYDINLDNPTSWDNRDVVKISWVRSLLEKKFKISPFVNSGGEKVLSLIEFRKNRQLEAQSVGREYLAYLESQLTSVSKIAEFLGRFLQHRPDLLSNSNHLPEMIQKKKYMEDSHVVWKGENFKKDVWRSPEQLIQDFENGFLLGDCEEFAFLAQHLLSKLPSPIQSSVIKIGSHATCVWTQKTKEGKYHAFTIGSYGSDWNAQVDEYLPFGESSYTVGDTFQQDGYHSVGAALNSVFHKYSKAYGDVLVAEEDPTVAILSIEKKDGKNLQVYREGNFSHEFAN